MRLMAISLTFFLLVHLATAISITEVELNPQGKDAGNEWIELYSEQESNLNGYYLENKDGDILNLNQSFSKFLLIKLNKQWLDNSDEKIFLKKDNQTLAETPILKDSEDSELTWNLCGSEWLFLPSTQEQENNCESNSIEQEVIQESPEKEAQSEETKKALLIPTKENENSSQKIQYQSLTYQDEKIILNSPESSAPKQFISKQEKLFQGIAISFTIFTLIIIILLALRKL